jgi:hypothetical protein
MSAPVRRHGFGMKTSGCTSIVGADPLPPIESNSGAMPAGRRGRRPRTRGSAPPVVFQGCPRHVWLTHLPWPQEFIVYVALIDYDRSHREAQFPRHARGASSILRVMVKIAETTSRSEPPARRTTAVTTSGTAWKGISGTPGRLPPGVHRRWPADTRLRPRSADESGRKSGRSVARHIHPC